MAATPALAIRDLSFTYKGAERPALDGISLTVAPGESVVILGASGAGKSTLCSALNGLIPHFVRGEMAGDVSIFGVSTRDRTVSQLAELVGLLFQEFESQLFCTSVDLEVAFGPENLRVPPEEIRRRVTEALAAVGLAGLERREPATLSGGQKQRLALGAVLALQPRLMVMDEPTTDLDPAGRAGLFALARRMRTERNLTVVTAEHDTEAALTADRVVVLERGRVAAEGPPDVLLAQVDGLERLGVAPPALARLLACLGVPVCLEVTEAAARLREHGFGLDPRVLANLEAAGRARAGAYGDPLFEVRGLEHRYENGTRALAGVDLSLRAGEFVALVGPNGSGKTTLARHLNGLLRPTRGEVRVCGEPTTGASLRQLGRAVGYVFQNPDHQLFAETVADEVAFGPRVHGQSPEEVRRRVEEALAAVDLTGREGEDPFSMTKGERQRVAVASVLATRPRALVLDEPTTGLDSRERRSMMEMVRRLNEAGHTILCVTHHLETVAENAHRTIVLQSGRIVQDGPTRDVLSCERELTEWGLCPPPIVQLGRHLGFPLLTVDEAAAALRRTPAQSPTSERLNA